MSLSSSQRVWKFVAIDADIKLVHSFLIERRDAQEATGFRVSLANELINRVEITSQEPSPRACAARFHYEGLIVGHEVSPESIPLRGAIQI